MHAFTRVAAQERPRGATVASARRPSASAAPGGVAGAAAIQRYCHYLRPACSTTKPTHSIRPHSTTLVPSTPCLPFSALHSPTAFIPPCAIPPLLLPLSVCAPLHPRLKPSPLVQRQSVTLTPPHNAAPAILLSLSTVPCVTPYASAGRCRWRSCRSCGGWEISCKLRRRVGRRRRRLGGGRRFPTLQTGSAAAAASSTCSYGSLRRAVILKRHKTADGRRNGLRTCG